MNRHGQQQQEQQQQPRGRPVSGLDAAHANEYFEHFLNATSLKNILGYYRSICEHLHLRPNVLPLFYPKLKANLTSWKAKALWKKFDARAIHKCYGKGKLCPNTRVLIIGAGPCGLRSAIEAQLLGAKVVVVEKRDRLSRNNVLHLWPFVIEDLRALGAKKFFGKFCAGSIDHISIRQLQCILFKVALLLGVEIHTEVSFERLIEPNASEKTGWRADVKPLNHPVLQYEFDVVIGADGKRNTLQGFKRKEFRGKLAIAITANFINKKTEAEAIVEEISGVAFIFNQKFFKDLHERTGIDLENIVYYKDDTHYFVMTAKKASLIEKGVILQDLADTERLLAPDNVNREALMSYAREAAEFSTKYQMPDLEFAVNHYGLADVAMFDFTSMYAADNASKVVERNGYRLLMILVGDSLLEPFWPTGSGCARGFLSSMDAAWAIRSWGSGSATPLDVLAERESIYRLLAQTTPDNLNKDCKAYTLDPATRYPNLNRNVLLPHQVVSLFDTDNPKSVEKMRRNSVDALQTEIPKKRRRGNVDNEVLLNWITDQVREHEDITITDFASVFRDGKVLCAILNHYRPDLLDYNAIKEDDAIKKNQLAIDILEKEIGIPPIMTGEEITNTEDYLSLATYLTQVYDTFRCEIPHIKHPKLPNPPDPEKNPDHSSSSRNKNNCSLVTLYNCKKCKQLDLEKLDSATAFRIICNKIKKKMERRVLLENSGYTRKSSGNKKAIKIRVKKSSKSIKKYCNQLMKNISKDFITNSSFMKEAGDCKPFPINKIKFYDENFKEINPDTISNVSSKADSSKIYAVCKSSSSIVKSHSLSFVDKNVKESISFIDKNDENKNVTNNLLSGTDGTIIIRILERKNKNECTFQNIKYNPVVNLITISSKAVCRFRTVARKGSSNNDKCHTSKKIKCQFDVNGICKNVKFSSLWNMSTLEADSRQPISNTYNRVSEWISSHDFTDFEVTKKFEPVENVDTNDTSNTLEDASSDLTSVTRYMEKMKSEAEKSLKEKEAVYTDLDKGDIKCAQSDSEENFVSKMKSIAKCKMVRSLSKFSQYSPLQTSYMCPASSHQSQFSVILEGEESELPESKQSAPSLKSFKQYQPHILPSSSTHHQQQQPSRPSSRHKRHADAGVPSKIGSMERKTRKRRTLEKVGASVDERQKVIEEIISNRSDRQNKRRQQRKLQTERFIKSMQMLHANAKPDKSQPFEDYSIFLYRQTAPNFEDRVKDLEKQFTYVPDYESKLPTQTKAGADEEIASRIKNLEDKWKEPQPVEKKPRDLLRAIGKIETSDWNIKEIEKKIMENKLGKPASKDKEKVPKWSKEQFLARQTKMEKQHLDRQNSAEAKFADIDKSIKHLEMKLKEGTARDLGQNKVASITEKLISKKPEENKPVQRSNSKPVILPAQNASQLCHFCNKRVYLMERLSAEGKFFHHGCFRCQYCNVQLRLGSYAFDRDGLYGFRFYCLQHYGMQAEPLPSKIFRKPSQRNVRDVKSPDKRQIKVSGVDLLDRVQTPERIEFANLSTGHISSDHEDLLSQMDEDEWTDKNFGASAAEFGSSDDESSSLSDTDSDDEDAFEEALEEPATKEGTMKWAELFKKRYSRKRHDSDSDDYSSTDHSSYYENSSDDDESDTATEGEEEIRARELRKQEVRVEPPVVQTDTGTDTEVVSDESTSSSSEVHNSATEISTDSEFAQDDPTPTREIPAIILNDFHVTKTRGSGGHAKKFQVTSGFIQSPSGGKAPKPQNIELKLSPLVPTVSPIIKPAPKLLPRTEGYALNRTQSTGGIAAKVSLELKKKYLLGETVLPGNIQKSGSASTLDTKLKSFHSNISDCQKLLKPAPEVSASMKTFCSKLDERVSPVLSPQSCVNFSKHFDNKVLDSKSDNGNESIILPPPDVTNVEVKEDSTKVIVCVNETEGRPRSPVHETSIIVPEIDWSKKKHNHSEDSLSNSSSAEEVPKTPVLNFEQIPRVEIQTIEDTEETKDDIPPDSLCIEAELNAAKEFKMEINSSLASEPPKSIASEKKSLNQPKPLPLLENENILPEVHTSLHITKQRLSEKDTALSGCNIEKQSPEEVKSVKTSSGRSTSSNGDSGAEQVTAALTETELSDWARDEDVSDDLGGVEFELNQENIKISRINKQPKNIPMMKSDARIAEIGEFDEMGHICDNKDKLGRDRELKNKTIITEGMSSMLCSNLDNIEFMDTGTETSSDDGLVDATNGYVLFKNEDDIAEDSLNPTINQIFESRNVEKQEKPLNTGYCIYDSEDNFGGRVIDLKPSDLEKLKQKQQNNLEHEDDSLLIIETGTTTEENTCSDSTVKNIAENVLEKDKIQITKLLSSENNNHKQRLEEKLAKLKEEQALLKRNNELTSHNEKNVDPNSIEFHEHCQRLQSKVEFGNAKDSIDIRKSKRKSKVDIPKPDLIQEEKEKSSPVHSPKNITLNLSPVVKTPDILYKKEFIEKERDVNQKLIQEMVMNKMKAENKSLERKKRNRNPAVGSLSSVKPFELSKSATADIIPCDTSSDCTTPTNRLSAYSTGSSNYATPDVLLTTNLVPLQKSQTVVAVSDSKINKLFQEQSDTPLSLHSTSSKKLFKDSNTKKCPEVLPTYSNNVTLPLARKALFTEDFKTPVAPPRQKNEEAKKTAEKLKQEARARAKLLSNEELGLSPEDKLAKLKEKVSKQNKDKERNKENENIDVHIQESIESLVMNTERRNSWLYANDTLKKKKNSSFRRSKSGDDCNQNQTKQLTCVKSSDNLTNEKPPSLKKQEAIKACRSDPNLLDTECKKPKKIKNKDRERKKSISTLLSGLFSSKKSPSGSKGLFSRISPKYKGLSKSCTNLELRDPEVVVEEPPRRKSFSETSHRKSRDTPPPVPPLPLHYTGYSLKDESSDEEHDKHKGKGSSDTLDQSVNLDYSASSLASRRSSKGVRKAVRQAQAKRHRMAQEIQRKLEEIEVKTRELEQQGVLVEKTLRGEGDSASAGVCRDEPELLREWFDLMRDRTELRRYEKELMIRAQELELEDRHARLQHELRERIENDDTKSQEDKQIERSIINEMMEIVEKRDSLISVLEEDRLRYSTEDRDFEEQMLAKGLRLTPIRKTPEK